MVANIIFIGMIHKTRPIFSTQFHPEAKGGPTDSSYLFDIYIENVMRYKQSQAVFQQGRDNKPSPLLIDLLAKERVGVQPPVVLAAAKAETENFVGVGQLAAAAGRLPIKARGRNAARRGQSRSLCLDTHRLDET